MMDIKQSTKVQIQIKRSFSCYSNNIRGIENTLFECQWIFLKKIYFSFIIYVMVNNLRK